MYFGYFVIIFPWEKVVAFKMNKLESPLPRDAKFDWNWPSASGEDENVKSLRTDRQTQRDGQTMWWEKDVTKKDIQIDFQE